MKKIARLALRSVTAASLTAALLSACAAEDSDDPDDVEIDEQEEQEVTDGAALTSEGSADLAHVGAYYAAPADLDQLAEEEQAAAAIADTEAAITDDMDDPECLIIETDGATFLDVTFDGCTSAGGRFTLDGTISADVTIEYGDCGGPECPVATVYTLSAEDLSLNATSLSGTWQVRDEVAEDAPMTFEGEAEFIGPLGNTATTSTSAVWERSGQCVTYSIDSQLTRVVGTVSISVTDVTRCAGECPASGDVELSLLRGTWNWQYDGDATVLVSGPRGERELTLPCAL
jgi:hypothetical protein